MNNRDTYLNNLSRSYGQSDNFVNIQYNYKKLRLIAYKGGRITASDEHIKALESEINEYENRLAKEGKLNIQEKSKKKEELGDVGVLEKRIKKSESLLSNKNFLAKVGEEVLNIKKAELEKLKSELEKLKS